MASFIAFNSLHLLIFFLSLLKFYSHTKAQLNFTFPFCDTSTNDTIGTSYDQNLNHTLSFLVSNISLNGFTNVSVGKNQNEVYGRLQCRGDVSIQSCQACAITAATQIRTLCPYQKEASVIRENCSLEYSYQPLSSEADGIPSIQLHNTQNASDPVRFDQLVEKLLTYLISEAASSSSKLASGSTDFTNLVKINGMTQCRGDSAQNSCLSCLKSIISQISGCCGGALGGRVISLGCNIRYETYKFIFLPISSSPSESVFPPAPSPQLSGISPTSSKPTVTTGYSGYV